MGRTTTTKEKKRKKENESKKEHKILNLDITAEIPSK